MVTLGAIAGILPTMWTLVVPVLLVAAVAIGLGEALYGPTADTLPLVLAGPGLAGRYTALHQVACAVVARTGTA